MQPETLMAWFVVIGPALAVIAALPVWLMGKRSMALTIHGLALAVVVVASLAATLISMSKGDMLITAGGVATIAAIAALAGLCFWSARQGILQSWLFWPMIFINGGIAAAMVQMLLFFKLQF